MVTAVLCIGSNSGDRRWYIDSMEAMIRTYLTEPFVRSDLMETEPVEVDNVQPWFLNRLIAGGFDRSAGELLAVCEAVERQLGRKEKGTGTMRTADIDILLFGDERISTDQLTIPHPALFSRRFCLEALFRMFPEWRLGDEQRTIMEYHSTLAPQLGSQAMRYLVANGSTYDY